MDNLVALSIDLQATLVGGYLAYKITTVGRSVGDRTEDVVLKVLAFGLVGKLLVLATRWLGDQLTAGPTPDQSWAENNYWIAIVLAVVAGALWRWKGSDFVSCVMERLDVYRDDHENSALQSLANGNAIWNDVQIQLADGSTLESEFARLPAKLPTARFMFNKDGLLAYVTKVHRADGSEIEFLDVAEGEFSTVSFVPRERINQIDVCWKRRQ